MMKLKILLLLGVLVALAASAEVPELGSGENNDDTLPEKNSVLSGMTDGSGDDTDSTDVADENDEDLGSGDEDGPAVRPGVVCPGGNIPCYCVDEKGDIIPGTHSANPVCNTGSATTAAAPAAPSSTTTAASNIPVRERDPAPMEKETEMVKDTTTSSGEDFIFVEETPTTIESAPPTSNDPLTRLGGDNRPEKQDVSTYGVEDKGVEIDNNVPVKPGMVPDSSIDEKKEEETNDLSGTGSLKQNEEPVEREEKEEAYISHPGILAALIGGGLVGLLCAVLLVLFIIYRIRKKDEGSYPLDDGKPNKNYAYSKAPSQEFYA